MLLWEVASLIGRPKLPPLPVVELQSLWDDLATADAQTAGKALRRLAEHPHQAAALLGQKLKPAAAAKEMLAKHLIDLGDAQFKVRERAATELKKLGEMAEPALRACLAGKPALEQRRRVELILARLGEPITDPNKLRALPVWRC